MSRFARPRTILRDRKLAPYVAIGDGAASLGVVCGLLLGGLGRPAQAQVGADPAPHSVLFVPSVMQGCTSIAITPSRDLTSATTARLSAWLFQRWLLAASYRFSYFSANPSAALVGASTAPWRQHRWLRDVWLCRAALWVSLHYGVLAGRCRPRRTIPRPRITSASPPATARLATVCWHFSASLFPSEIIYRGELAGALPLCPASSRWAL